MAEASTLSSRRIVVLVVGPSRYLKMCPEGGDEACVCVVAVEYIGDWGAGGEDWASHRGRW